MSLSVVTLVATLAAATGGCGGSTSADPSVGTIDNASELATLMDAIAVPLASLFKQISAAPPVAPDSRSGLAALTTPVGCPAGGSISYTYAVPAHATFSSCNVGGFVISGILYATLSTYPTGGSLPLDGGTLTFGGYASGSLTILSGLIQWSDPIGDATTYWEVTASLGGSAVCVWSGGGACR